LAESEVQTTKVVEITPELQERANRAAQPYGANPALHDSDHLLSYLITYSKGDGLAEYFENGAVDARKVEEIVTRLNLPADVRTLEFASGYGRVTRHLTGMNLVASDIHPEAVQFTRDRLGVQAVQATPMPEDFEPGERFDFIFVLSLFSHLPDDLFGRWMKKLIDLLTPDGYLQFTTHGEKAAKNVSVLAEVFNEETGYGYFPGSDQLDIGTSIYGSSIVSTAYTARQVREAGGDLIYYTARRWWANQDEWIVKRW
jgi:SAM-dependent methyltransferase